MKSIWHWGRTPLLLLLVSALIFVGCSSSSESAEKILKMNMPTGEPESLDPAKAFDEQSMDVVNALFEGLLRLDEEHQPQPAVAEEVEKSADGLVYTFHLGEAKWSNGEPVTAEDFEYAWKRVLNPDTAAKPAFLLYFIENAEAYNNGEAKEDEVGVKALDEKTLEVRLGQPTPYFEQLVCYTPFYPVYKKGLEEDDKMYGSAKAFVSNGPFKLTEWSHDSKIKAEKNEHYREADKVKLDGIEWAMVKDVNTAYQMYENGEFHIGVAPNDLQAKLIEEGKIEVGPSSGLEFFRFNVTKEPFTNKKIRQAFALAVDRKTIIENVVQGNQEAALAYVAPGTVTSLGDFRENSDDRIEDAQFAEAKKLLEEGMKEEGWNELPKVSLLYNDTEQNKVVAEVLQETYRKHLGITIELESVEVGTYFERRGNLDYNIARSSFIADYNDPYNYLESFQTGHSMNQTGWSNKKYDELLKKAFVEADDHRRMEHLYEAEKLLFEEMPIFPLYYYNSRIMQKEEVSNVLRHPVGPNDYRFVDIKQ